MKLSIGMIVKNEEANLEKCLTALKPILENVDSELIIADTGSTDNTVEIAKKFTDKVFYFKWINDFAAARNFTMEKSQGEWFMYIDADEYLQSCDEIIHFFNSSEHNKYVIATYIQRNYSRLNDYSEYSDHHALRLCKMLPGRRFVGKIHEIFNTAEFGGNLKFFNTVADHFGYAFSSDPELEKNKLERNLKLLLEQVKEGDITDHPLVYKQISDCYSVSDNDKALEYINIGLSLLKGKTDVGYAIIDYYVKKAHILLKMNRYEEVIEVCNEFLTETNYIRNGKRLNADIEITVLKADSLKHLERYNEALTEYTDFFKLVRDSKRGRMDTPDKLLANRRFSSDANIKNIMNDFAMICVLQQRFVALDDSLKILPIQDYADNHEYIDFRINLQFEIMNHLGYKDLQKFYNALDDYGKKAFNKFSRHGVFFTDKQAERIKAILSLKTPDTELLDAFKLYQSYLLNNEQSGDKIYRFAEKYGYENYPELLYLLMRINADITPFVNCDFFDKAAAKNIVEKYPDIGDIFSNYDIDAISGSGLEKLTYIAKIVMDKQVEKKALNNNVLQKYGMIGYKWCSEYENEENIPAAIQPAILLYNITDARRKKNYKLCISQLRQLIKDFPEFAAFVSQYQESLKHEVMLQKNVNTELSGMAHAVKQNIAKMIDSGDIAAAENTLLELEKLCPSDPDIENIRNRINALKASD